MQKMILVLTLLVSFSGSALAYEAGDWVARVGLANVEPDASSSNIFVGGGDLGFGVDVEDDTQLGLNLAYFITDKWNVELLASTPFDHDIVVNDNPLGLSELSTATQLPPTVTFNYFLASASSSFQPYIGVGVNLTVFFDEEFTDANEALGFSDLDLDESFGVAAQIGFDYFLSDKWLLNVSVRYIDISTDATFTLNNAALGVDNAPGEVSVDIDPIVTTLSVGYRF